jgi:hypothetical protein
MQYSVGFAPVFSLMREQWLLNTEYWLLRKVPKLEKNR